jgi:hypothetical protein
MLITPINEAESIIDPFWDAALSELGQWAIDSGAEHGLAVQQSWCWVEFDWMRCPAAGPALRMRRTCGIECGDYDRLVLSVMAPEKAVVRIIAETDRGTLQLDGLPADTKKKELALDLNGAVRLEAVTIEVIAGGEGIAKGWFNWLGLQHSGRLARKLNRPSGWDARWERHLKDESFDPQFQPAYGLVLDAGELDALRRRHAVLTGDGKTSPFTAAGAAAWGTPPEAMIHDFVNFWNDSRYNRERDYGKFILNHGLNAAIAGHLLKDKSLLRLAARYALSIAMCGRWDDGFICRFPGGAFDHRCFVQSLCAYEVAGILDLAGECFTDVGRNFLLRRLSEEAIGSIQFNTWNYDYIFRCNQLAWFTPGRMLALGVLSRHYPRVRPYLDIAYRELCESLEATILPDGGYPEGSTYFRCVGRDAGLGIYYYSRATGQPMADLVPACMTRCSDFAGTFASMDEAQDMVAVCDAVPLHEIGSQAIMAGLLPQSAWLPMLHKTIARNDGWPVNAIHGSEGYPSMLADAAIAWMLVERLDAAPWDPPPFVALPDMGPMASHRQLGGHWVKLLIQGNKSGAGHAHEDKGSFVLEFAGDTFALDPGTCDYSHPMAGLFKQCERHNMLVPFGFSVRPAPPLCLHHDVKPTGMGGAVCFRAEIDATPGWEPYYKRWHRSWDSPSPDRLTITDDYELAAGDGVEFYWQTKLPVAVEGSKAVITGRSARLELEASAGCLWRMDELPLIDGSQHRLAFQQRGKSGRLVVQTRLLVSGR